MYSIDTNIYMDWWSRRYPPDIFPGVKQRIDNLATTGKAFSPEAVKTEINHVGHVDLKAWARTNNAIFCMHEVAVQQQANQIVQRFPGFVDPNAIHDEADRWVIALAICKKLTVVTHETRAVDKRRAARTHYIPDVCHQLSVPCIDLLQLMRLEKWKF